MQLDLAGKTFGQWTVTPVTENRRHGHIYWLCNCSCGRSYFVLGNKLKGGKSKGCAPCGRIKRIKHGKRGTQEYSSWNAMIQRCTNPNVKNYYNYGGRGITVCARWLNSFEDFLKDMGLRPSRKHSIDRINNNEGYNPDNCRWADNRTQFRNKRNCHLITWHNKTLCIADWCDLLNIKRSILIKRLRLGWAVEKAFNTPLSIKHSHLLSKKENSNENRFFPPQY